VIEDELILALPVVPVKPGSAPAAHSWGEPEPVHEEEAKPNPFAVLKNMKVAR